MLFAAVVMDVEAGIVMVRKKIHSGWT